jgi:hypothetical protein
VIDEQEAAGAVTPDIVEIRKALTADQLENSRALLQDNQRRCGLREQLNNPFST